MPRPEGALREAILAMRERIREAKGGALSPVAKGFALKQDRGGIVDIEFMVQYFVLAWSAEDSGLLAWTDVLRILAAAQASGRLQAPLASLLRDGYLALRAEGHRRALRGTDSRTDDPSVVALAQQVAEIWAGFAAEGGRYFGPKGP